MSPRQPVVSLFLWTQPLAPPAIPACSSHGPPPKLVSGPLSRGVPSDSLFLFLAGGTCPEVENDDVAGALAPAPNGLHPLPEDALPPLDVITPSSMAQRFYQTSIFLLAPCVSAFLPVFFVPISGKKDCPPPVLSDGCPSFKLVSTPVPS